jgi:hypothetical protein
MRWTWSFGLAVLAAACGDDGAADDGGLDAAVDASTDGGSDDAFDAPNDALGCPQLWTVSDPGTAMVELIVDVGELEIRATGLPIGPNTELVQGGLVGDFEAEVELLRFEPGFQGAYVQAKLRSGDGTEAVAGIGTSPSAGVFAAFLFETPNIDTAETSDVDATLRFVRAGSTLTITAATATATAEVSDTLDGALEIGLQIGNNGIIPIDDLTRVRIPEFSVMPQGAVRSDPFDCDTLVR